MRRVATMGAIAEGQRFFWAGAKPPRRFWDRASALLMAGRGWGAEWQVLETRTEKADAFTSIALCQYDPVAVIMPVCMVRRYDDHAQGRGA